MTKDHFSEQLNRLRSEWPNSYGAERSLMLWDAFRNEQDARFERAVNRALQTLRSAPLVPELMRIFEELKIEDAHVARERAMGQGSFMQVLKDASKNNRRANPEYVKACLKVFQDRDAGRLTLDQFKQGCDFLDETAGKMK